MWMWSWKAGSMARVPLMLLVALVALAGGEVARPRGVPLSRAALYSPLKEFRCLDGSGTVPFAHVNDDYCDCFDGSDEPGTPACVNGVFHCANAGHRALNLPSSRVNDGVCDCCDGSDEYAPAATGVSCDDTCAELGREARARAQRRAELLRAGASLRLDLAERGAAARADTAQRLTRLALDQAEAEKLEAERRDLKVQLEEKENEALRVYREAEELARAAAAEEERRTGEEEAREIFAKFDSDSDGLLTLAELQTRAAFDKNRDGQIDNEEARYFLNEREDVDLETFVTEAWSRVKPFLMIEQGTFVPPASDKSEVDDMVAAEEGQSGHEEAELETEEGETEAEAEGEEEELEPAEDVDEAESEPARKYDAQTQELVNAATEARRQHADAERTVREIESSIRSIKESLEKDFGSQHEFATLDGQCLEHEDKEYVYKLCLFSKVTQKSKNGGGEIGLGNWGEWAGDEGDRYRAMKYTNGISCWNGPNRSTLVNIQCGLETKILSVSEPYRCEYQMEFSTPAACDDTRPAQAPPHDEL